jgi:hypothetical protein
MAYIVKPDDLDGFDDAIKAIDALFVGMIEPPPAG